MTIDTDRTRTFVQRTWDTDIIPALTEYIRIPAKSPMYDEQWAEHGHLERAVTLITDWARQRKIEGLKLEVVRLPGRTPVILMEVPGAGGDTVLLYGHCDKQPEMVGWAEDAGPWVPVRRGNRLFGRGAGDDGYAAFSALTAIEALQAQGVAHNRCVVLIEASEESGSPDLPAYVEKLADRIRPGLVVCLDSGCGDYDHLWATTSLRGVTSGNLTVEVLGEGVHSGAASGIVPSSFRILRQLLGRLEDERTGEILVRECHVEIPPARVAEARAVAAVLGDEITKRWPFVPGMRPVTTDPVEALLNNTWRPALAVTGVDGIPALADAGNVLRPKTSLKLSLRLPPTADAAPRHEAREGNAGGRPALRRPRDVLDRRAAGQRLERAGHGRLAARLGQARLDRALRRAADVQRSWRLDPVHADAGRPLPRGAVPGDRRDGPRVQCARPQRVHRPAHRHEGHRVRLQRPGRSPRGHTTGVADSSPPLVTRKFMAHHPRHRLW